MDLAVRKRVERVASDGGKTRIELSCLPWRWDSLNTGKELTKQCQTMGRTCTHSPPLGIERNGMCDVMIRSRVRSRVVRSYLPGQASLVLRNRSNEGVANGTRGKMVEDRNITPPLKNHVLVI